MKRTLNAVVIALMLFQFAIAQTATVQEPPKPPGTTRDSDQSPAKHYKNVRIQADQFNAAFIAGDFARAADLTYFTVVESFGGRARYIADLDKTRKEMLADEFRLLSITAGEPLEVFEVEHQIYAILPTRIEAKVAEGRLFGQAAIVGVSKDGGENWTFVSIGSKPEPAQLKTLFPGAADRIHLPEFEPAVLQPDKKPN